MIIESMELTINPIVLTLCSLVFAIWLISAVMTIVKIVKWLKRKKCKHEAVSNLDSLGIAICYDCKKEV
tara:strand:- start:171 stop:377 length:207 start_codon:yes stop_codon:yes gene_type:complete